MPDEYDVVVIGAGPTGENVSDRAIIAPIPGLAGARPWTSREATSAGRTSEKAR